MKRDINIGVFGLWHLGCVLSACWAKLGFSVTGFDFDQDVVDNLNDAKAPIFEPGLDELIVSTKQSKHISFTTDLAGIRKCDYLFIAFDTQVLDNDEVDLGVLEKTISSIKSKLKNESVVIISSQIPVGTCRRYRSEIQAENSSIELVCSPENLRLGSAIHCYLNPGRVIVGGESELAIEKCQHIFHEICPDILKMNLASAEMVKHATNCFLATSVVFADNLADLCEVAKADICDVVVGLKSDERIGKKAYLAPGIGFSGGTLGRDLKILSHLNRKSDGKAKLYEVLHQLNSERKFLIVDKIRTILGGEIQGKKIAALGLTYKPGTSTLRRSLPIEIVKLLGCEGGVISGYDPKADYNECEEPLPFQIALSLQEAVGGSDLVLLLTEWEEFKKHDWLIEKKNMRSPNFFDTKNYLNGHLLRDGGYRYFDIGRYSGAENAKIK